MIDAIAEEALRDLEDLRYRVEIQKKTPDVRAGTVAQVVYLRAVAEGSSSASASLTVKKPDDDPAT